MSKTLSFDQLVNNIHAGARKGKSKKGKKVVTGDAAFLQEHGITSTTPDASLAEAVATERTTNKMLTGESGAGADLDSHRKLMKIRKEIKQHQAQQKESEPLKETHIDPDDETKGGIIRQKDKKINEKLEKKRKREKKLEQKQKQQEEEKQRSLPPKPQEDEAKPTEPIHRRTVKVLENKLRKDGRSKRTKTRSRQKNKRKDTRSVEEKMQKLGAKFQQ